MVIALIDTSIVVDLLRGYEPAQSWFVEQQSLGISQAVWLEIIEGAQNQRSLQAALRLLRRFDQIEITSDDMAWAIRNLTQFKLSHNIDAFDCLIAASCQRFNLPLYTRNLKHFAPLIPPLVRQPY